MLTNLFESGVVREILEFPISQRRNLMLLASLLCFIWRCSVALVSDADTNFVAPTYFLQIFSLNYNFEIFLNVRQKLGWKQ